MVYKCCGVGELSYCVYLWNILTPEEDCSGVRPFGHVSLATAYTCFKRAGLTGTGGCAIGNRKERYTANLRKSFVERDWIDENGNGDMLRRFIDTKECISAC